MARFNGTLFLLLLISSTALAQGPSYVPCNELGFYKALGDPSVFIDRTGNNLSLATKATVAILKKSIMKNRALPSWLFPLNGWLTPGFGSDSAMPEDGCSIWRGDEWYTRAVFIPHDAPDGHGFIAINLSKKKSFVLITKDNFIKNKISQETIAVIGNEEDIRDIASAYPALVQ